MPRNPTIVGVRPLASCLQTKPAYPEPVVRPLLPLLLLAALPACAPPQPLPTEFDDAFTRASEASGVPYEVLAATSYAFTRWNPYVAVGVSEADGAGATGVMHLHVDGSNPSVDEAAALTELPNQRITGEVGANVLGAAMIMRERAEQILDLTGNRVDTFEEWYPVVAEMSGAVDPAVADGFAAQVYDYMQYGLIDATVDGEMITIEPQSFAWRESRMAVSSSGAVDQWIPACSSNYSDYSRGGGDIRTIVIHDTEGSYSGAISWFQNCSASVSAHYVVRSSDGQITQMVKDEDVAWHAGDWTTNLHSIGIEHEGYASDPDRWYTDNMYRASAALVAGLCDAYGIPKDRAHIIGHYQVPGCSSGGGGSGCHTDPGDGWDWDYYMSLVTGTGSGSTSLGGSGLADGPRNGAFSAKLTATRYGETDTCEGPVSGAVNNGQLYLSGTCTLKNHPDKSGNMPVTWTGQADGTAWRGTVFVDGRSSTFTGTLNTDGSVAASAGGSEDLGGDVGVIDYSFTIAAAP